MGLGSVYWLLIVDWILRCGYCIQQWRQINTSLGFNRNRLSEMSCVRHQREVCHFHRKVNLKRIIIIKRMHGLIFITQSITCIWKIDRMTLHIMPTLKESYIQLYSQHLWQDVHYHRKFNKFPREILTCSTVCKKKT